MGIAAGHHAPCAGRVRRAAALASLLALAAAGCQAGMRSSGPGSGVSTSRPSAPASGPVPARAVPAPAGGGTYAAFCGAGAGCPGGGVPAALRRPIHLPHVAAGTRCPVSAAVRKVDPKEEAVIGPGPVYALSFWLSRRAVMPFVLPSPGLFGGSAWGGQILKWVGAPSYHGPVLIRGRDLTGPGGLGFGAGTVPLAEMDVPGGPAGGVGLNPGGWRLWPGYARLRSPGCCLSSPPRQQTGRCGSA